MFLNFSLLLLVLPQFCITLKIGIGEKQKKSGYIDGDFMIGALFPVHERPLLNGSNDPLVCGVIRERYGIQRIEAAFFAIETINNDTNILPEIKLGINIKDECSSESVALHQTIRLIEEPTVSNENVLEQDTCKPINEDDIVPLIGVIGPNSSPTTITVQNLLKLFQIPQIGYSATSADLTDVKNYPYLLRVVPSDEFQVYLIFKLLKKFNWSYISIVYTNDNYGQSGMNILRKSVSDFGICIAKIVDVPGTDEEYPYNSAIEELLEDDKAKVVVCFCDGLSITSLLKAMRRHNLTNRFLLIGSDGWNSRYAVVEGYEEEAQGSLTIGIQTNSIPEFDQYYFGKNLINNKRNPWFEEFWEYRFDCNVNNTENSYLPVCTGKEDLKVDHEQDSKIPYVIKSIYTLAYGLHHMQADICKNQTPLCDDLYPFNSTMFLEYLLKTNFTYGNDHVNFSSYRDPWHIRYNIFNFRKLENESYDYVKIGQYDGNTAELEDSDYDEYFFDYLNLTGIIQFPGGSTKPITSICSDPCPPGQIKLDRTGQDKLCCWNCVPCKSDEFQINTTACQKCPTGYWPNRNQTSCYMVPLTYPHWMDIQSIVSLIFSILGIILTSLTAIVFIKYRETPVVKSSTRELCYMMLIGMIMAHSITFAVVSKPTVVTCTIVRTIPAISFTIIYAALLVKTNRIARILAISKKKFPNLNPRFMSLPAQITITSILIVIEIIICIIMLITEPPVPFKEYGQEDQEPYAWLSCPVSPNAILVPFSFVAFFVIMCTLYAIKTRNLPDNFNEAKFIGFSMYVTCITWIAFGLIYYGSDFQVVTTCICSSTNALVILTFLFFPKLYIILWVPERNTRANFTTTKGIRCIIGREDSSLEANKKKLLETDFKYIPDFNARKRKSLPELSEIRLQKRKSLSEDSDKV